MNKNQKYSSSLFFLASMFVHGVALVLILIAPRTETPPNSEAIELTVTSTDQGPDVALEKAPKNEVQTKAKQIVEQDVNQKDEAPVNTKYLSASNQKVEKETVAKKSGEFKNRDSVKQSKLAGAKNASDSATQASQAAAEPAKETPTSKEDLLFKSYGLNSKTGNSLGSQAESRGNEGLDKQEQKSTSQAMDESQTQDYLKDKDKGMVTLLNTREFKYYSYYSRIRRQLSQHWETKVRVKLVKIFKQGRSPAATAQDRITKLMIILNSQGTLVRVQVLRDSGVTDLDDAAIEAFRAAAPFPNPPAGIVENDGTVKISWDFVLET